MSYQSQDALTADPVMQGRVRQALVRVAQNDVIAEPTNTPEHEARVILARAVLADPTSLTSRMIHSILADDAMTSGATDADLFSRVYSLWNEHAAGVP